MEHLILVINEIIETDVEHCCNLLKSENKNVKKFLKKI